MTPKKNYVNDHLDGETVHQALRRVIYTPQNKKHWYRALLKVFFEHGMDFEGTLEHTVDAEIEADIENILVYIAQASRIEPTQYPFD